MIFAADAENHVVAGEVDFDHHVLRGHFLQQIVGAIFVHDVDAVADALGVGLFDGEANVAAEALGRNQAGGELAGVQADVDLGIKAMQEADHAHVQGVVVHGSVAVFGHHEIDADDARIGGGGFKAEQRLREDLLLRKAAENLVEIADLDAAGGSFVLFWPQCSRCGAVASAWSRAGAGSGNVVAQAAGQKLGRASARNRTCQPIFFGDGRGVAEIGRVHQFEVLLVLRGGASGNLVEPFARCGADRCCRPEIVEGVEEMVVRGDAWRAGRSRASKKRR